MTAIQVAQMIIRETKAKNITLNNTKLQKLLYIVYGLYLVENRNILFSELPLYLPYGPVFDSVYQKYKGQDSITDTEYNSSLDENPDFCKSLHTAIQLFGNYSAKVLSDWSHREGGAWSKVEQSHPQKWGTPLHILDIAEEFDNIINREI